MPFNPFHSFIKVREGRMRERDRGRGRTDGEMERCCSMEREGEKARVRGKKKLSLSCASRVAPSIINLKLDPAVISKFN